MVADQPLIQTHRGSPSQLHALDPFGEGADPVGRSVWICEPSVAGLVLGSRQSIEVVDQEACRRAGLEIATRRSGGGAVLIVPGDVVWIDVVVSPGDLPDDVRASMVLVGDCWKHALIDTAVDAGVDADTLAVHREGMVQSDWSNLVCFAGVGPGEVLLDGDKLVGLSQRRSRHGVRIQGLLHRRSDLAAMRSLFSASPAAELREPACLPVVDTMWLAERVATHLANRLATR